MSEETAALRTAATITWVPLIWVGVLVAVVGGVALAAPAATITFLTVLIALWLLVTGLGRVGLGAVMAVWSTGRRVLSVLTGMVLAAAGVAALLNLQGSAVVLGWAIGIGLLIGAAGDVATLVSGRARRSRTALVVLAVAQLVIGVVFLLEPAAGMEGIALLLGGSLVAIGVGAVVGGLVVRHRVHGFLDQVTGPGGRGPDDSGPEVIEGRVL